MDERYCTPQMGAIWNPRTRNQHERQLWVTIMRAQQTAGVPIPEDAIEDYEAAAQDIPQFGNLELSDIAKIERRTKHDLYARLQYFNEVAGHQWAHLGLTSADIVENAQQMQIRESAELLLDHTEQLAMRLTKLAQEWSHDAMVGRTHGRPAQLTTIGKRITDWVAELAHAASALITAVENYPNRGIHGAIGTRLDLAALLARHRPADSEHSALELADQVDTAAMRATDAPSLLASCGQTYPRSLDLPIVSATLQLAAACDTVCTNIRLWAVLGHANEQHTPGQVGSSAMPHKTNPRYSERVHSLCVVARGYASMLQELAGAQWFEGDVSTSAARRVALPGLFHTVDAVLANTACALDRLQFNREEIARDVKQHLPQLASGLLLEAYTAAGVSRATAHALMSEYAQQGEQGWLSSLATDPHLPLDREQVEQLVSVSRMAEPAIRYVEQLLHEINVGELAPAWPGDLV